MGFRMKISMKMVYQYLTIYFNFQIRSSHLHPLQVGNCDSNSRLVVDEDDNGKVRPEGVKWLNLCMLTFTRGDIILHGPHQGAQTNTTTSLSASACRTSVSKLACKKITHDVYIPLLLSNRLDEKTGSCHQR